MLHSLNRQWDSNSQFDPTSALESQLWKLKLKGDKGWRGWYGARVATILDSSKRLGLGIF